MNKDKKTQKPTIHSPVVGPMNNHGMFPADPLGSYTGRPTDIWDEPVQDADDL